MEFEGSDNKAPSPNVSVAESGDFATSDEKDMARMGKEQEFHRNFSWLSSVGFTSCTMGTWEFVFINNFQAVVDGGRAGMFWGYVWVIIGQFFIVLSLAEMSSMAPTAGGQYHWVSEFAPRNVQKILSYTSGWLSSLCWQSFVAADCLYTAQLFMSLASIQNTEFIVERGYCAGLSIGIVIFTTVLNIWGARKLALVETVFVALHVMCFFIVLITVAVTSPKVSASEAFLGFSDNGGGFPTMGLAVMVGQVSAMWNVLASDAVAHISEEVVDAATTTPRAMFWSYALNIPLAFAMLIVFIFSLGDPAASTAYTFPFIWILENSLSKSGATAITALLGILVFMINISAYASTIRQFFAFARDDGFPASNWLKKVDPKLEVPVNCCWVTCVITIILSLIYIGSAVAFNAIISLGLVALMATYGISIGCVLYRRLKWPETLPPVKWSLGKWGVPVNGIALVYSIFSFFWSFWPIYWEPNAQEMNWAIVMFGGVMIIACVSYLVKARHVYTGPVAKCKQ